MAFESGRTPGKEECKAKTRSGDPTPEASKLKKLDEIIRGWVNYYSVAKAKTEIQQMDIIATFLLDCILQSD
ncbi:MAG: group II intron maturase-specific domain-containing protein, partial [Chitinophagaceae bacterium]